MCHLLAFSGGWYVIVQVLVVKIWGIIMLKFPKEDLELIDNDIQKYLIAADEQDLPLVILIAPNYFWYTYILMPKSKSFIMGQLKPSIHFLVL